MAGIYKKKRGVQMSKQKGCVLASLFSLVALIAACTNQPQKETVSTKRRNNPCGSS